MFLEVTTNLYNVPPVTELTVNAVIEGKSTNSMNESVSPLVVAILVASPLSQ